MFLLRIVALLTVITLGSCILAWIMTRDRRYLGYAGRIGKGALAFSLLLLMLLAAERLLTL